MILHVSEPLVVSYPNLAAPFAILGEYDMDAMTWLVTHSMVHAVYWDKKSMEIKSNLACDLSPWDFRFFYDVCPFLKTRKYDREYLKDMNTNILSFVQWQVAKGNYLHLDMNVAWLPVYGYCGGYSCHNVFVYGIDDEKIYCMDSIGRAPFKAYTCTHEEFRKAYETYIPNPYWKTGFEDIYVITYLKYPELRKEYPPQVYESRENLACHVKREIEKMTGNVTRDYMVEKSEYAYGLNCYSLLMNYFESMIEKDPLNRDWHMRTALSFLLDHKRVMAWLFSYALPDAKMAGCYHELERMARLCVLRNLKYTIKRDKRELVMVCENLRRMHSLESNILAQY